MYQVIKEENTSEETIPASHKATPSLKFGESLIMLGEGFRGQPYECPTGHTTIGYGRNLDDNPLTEREGAYLMRNDIEHYKKLLLKEEWFRKLDYVRKWVILSMTFTLGIKGINRFIRMISALQMGNYDLAAHEMEDSKWYYQVGTRGKMLAQMMRDGEWPDEVVRFARQQSN